MISTAGDRNRRRRRWLGRTIGGPALIVLAAVRVSKQLFKAPESSGERNESYCGSSTYVNPHGSRHGDCRCREVGRVIARRACPMPAESNERLAVKVSRAFEREAGAGLAGRLGGSWVTSSGAVEAEILRGRLCRRTTDSLLGVSLGANSELGSSLLSCLYFFVSFSTKALPNPWL